MMLQKAALLGASINNEEAWQLVALYQQSDPNEFLSTIHAILASFLDLTQDHFEEAGFPLCTRTLPDASFRPFVDNSDLDTSADEADDHFSKQSFIFENHTAPIIHGNSSNQDRRRPLLMEKNSLIQDSSLLPSFCKPDSQSSTPKSSHSNSGDVTSFLPPPTKRPLFAFSHQSMRPASAAFDSALPKNASYSRICRYLMDYMLANKSELITLRVILLRLAVCNLRPGNQLRIKELEQRLHLIINDIDYCRMEEPTPPSELPELIFSLDRSRPTPKRLVMYQEFEQFSPYDLACLLIKYVPKCCVLSDRKSGKCLLPESISELLFMATKLQYSLNQADASEDWMEILCQARQMLAYRVAIQLLLPRPERKLLLKLLQLFKSVTNHIESHMSAQSIAICVSMAIFGSPTEFETLDQNDELTLRLRIDTLTNLIKLANDLQALPGIVYTNVRQNLRAKVGHSPVRKSARRLNDVPQYARVKYGVNPITCKPPLQVSLPIIIYETCYFMGLLLTALFAFFQQRSISVSAKTVKFGSQTRIPATSTTMTTSVKAEAKSTKLKEAFRNWRKVKNSNPLQKAKSSIQLKRKHVVDS
ncbi:hypothetical protein Ciccas_003781 [Cichlidogyrus casuarinus]|uniref:Rho-GAP domain-containing protein n=1 Tax=Cichlidogyrus casuarinus TaxID=1844966 RepID=A0ABD2QDH1_9PLAT